METMTLHPCAFAFRPGRRCVVPLLVLLIVMLLGAGPLYGQRQDDPATLNANQTLREATGNYKTGQFEQVVVSLKALLLRRGLKGTQRTEARLLLANTYLAYDSLDVAEAEVKRLIRMNPNFNPDFYETQGLSSSLLKDLVAEVRRTLSATQVSSVSKRNEDVGEAPATVVLLTEEEIRQRGYRDLEAAIHDLPGFDITRGNGVAYSNIYQRGYRQNSTERTLFLVDGIEENALWSSIVWLSRQFSLSNVKRLEVVYGPASTMYGSNAFLGVINVITKEPVDLIGINRRFGVSGQVGLGQQNNQYLDLTLAGQPNENVSFTLTGRLFRADERDLSGFEDWNYQLPGTEEYQSILTLTGDEADLLGQEFPNSRFFVQSDSLDQTLVPTEAGIEEARRQDEAALQQGFEDNSVRYGNTTDDWLLSAKLRMGNLTLGAQTWRRDEGQIGWYKDTYFAGSANDAAWIPRQTFFYARYDRTLTDKLSISSFTRYKLHELDEQTRFVVFRSYASGRLGLSDLEDNTASRFSPLFFYRVSRQLRSELRGVYNVTEKFNVVGGVEFRSSFIQGEYLTKSDTLDTTLNARETGSPNRGPNKDKVIPGGNHFNGLDMGLYTQASYRPNSLWTLIGGLRLDYNTVRDTLGYGTVFNSRLGVVVTPGDWVLKAIYSTAFKDADNRSKYSTVLGVRDVPNPTLRPEQVTNYEVSVARKIGTAFFADVAGYWAAYSQTFGNVSYICTATDDTVYGCAAGTETFQNQNTGSLQIRGLQATLKVLPRPVLGAAVSGYANYTFTDPRNTAGSTEVRIGDIASHQINVGLNARRGGLNVNLRMNYVGARDTGASTTVVNNPFDTFDAYTVFHATVSYTLAGRATVQLIGTNLFNLRYYHPGVRGAAAQYASQLPQNERHLLLRLLLSI